MPCLLDVDPYVPLCLEVGPRMVQRRNARRASILAATRRVMANRGYRHFNVAEVADECGVSIQTIYYNFGNKRQLLATALHEYNVILHHNCSRKNATPIIFLDIVLEYYKCACITPEFMREWILCAYDPTQPLLLDFQKKGQGLKARIIRDLSKKHPVKSGVNPRAVAYLLSKTNTSSLFDWVHHQNYQELKASMITSTLEVICTSYADMNERVKAWTESYLNTERALVLQ